MRNSSTATRGNIFLPVLSSVVCVNGSERGWPLPVFEGCSADTIMVVAVWGPVTKDCVDAVGTSVPCGVVITNPATRKRNTITVCAMCGLDKLQRRNRHNLRTRGNAEHATSQLWQREPVLGLTGERSKQTEVGYTGLSHIRITAHLKTETPL